MLFNQQIQAKNGSTGRTWIILNKLKQFMQSILSFLILAAFTLIVAGIYYGVEKNHCNESYRVARHNATNPAIELKTYWQALHFIVTLESTIGYGDITPCTIWGQLMAVIFAVIGIPLFLVCLTHVGRWLEDDLNRFYLWFKGPAKNKTLKTKSEVIIFADFVPLSLGLGVTLAWILLCSVYFYFTLQPFYNDNFNFFTAIYFTLISFLTIGLGDVSPVDYKLTLVTFVFIMMGLALVTMCIDIVQTKMEIMFHNVKLLLEWERKNQLASGDQMSTDPKVAEKLIEKLIRQEPNAKWFSMFISDKSKHHLVETCKELSKSVSKSTQTDRKLTIDRETFMDTYPDDEPPKTIIIRYTKKHPRPADRDTDSATTQRQ